MSIDYYRSKVFGPRSKMLKLRVQTGLAKLPHSGFIIIREIIIIIIIIIIIYYYYYYYYYYY